MDRHSSLPMGPRRVLTAILVLVAVMISTAAIQASSPDGTKLLDDLRRGGHVIYIRHARTDSSQSDRDRADLSDCRMQRNLSPEGEVQARRLGAAIEALGIPVGSVLASPYCRTLQTAQLAFGHMTVTEELRQDWPEAGRDAAAVAGSLRRLLGEQPSPGTNTVLVAHGNNMRWAEGFQLAEGEAAIFRPDGNGRSALVARLTPEQWVDLSQPNHSPDER